MGDLDGFFQFLVDSVWILDFEKVHVHHKSYLLAQSSSKQKTKWKAAMRSAWNDISAMYI